jgi:hypothetical protein
VPCDSHDVDVLKFGPAPAVTGASDARPRAASISRPGGTAQKSALGDTNPTVTERHVPGKLRSVQ